MITKHNLTNKSKPKLLLMKKALTLLMVIFSFLLANAQEELIRNGDFSQGVSGSSNLKDISFWNMDMETPGSGWWSEHVGMTSTDTTLYQVVETITEDSVVYTLKFDANNTWISDKIIAIASVTAGDSTIRTRIASQEITLVATSTSYEFVFGFPANSGHVGKKLVIEFDLTSTESGAAWTDLDNVSLKKVIAGVNSAPIAVVGPSQTVKGGTLVTLDGTGSNDFEGSELTYLWTSVYPGIFLSDRRVASPSFTAPDVTELTTFEFTLFVNDGELASEIAIASVTVFPAGELIRNGGFEEYAPGSDPVSSKLNHIAYWFMDEHPDSTKGGRYGSTGMKFVTLASIDSALYQVIKTIGTAEATYTLTFSARSSWNSLAVKSTFSVSGADSSIRTPINSKMADFGIDVTGGVNTSVTKVFSHIFVIPANSEHAGKKLIVEFDNIPNDDGTNNGWAEMDNISLIEVLASGIEKHGNLKLNIYPNPASDVINI